MISDKSKSLSGCHNSNLTAVLHHVMDLMGLNLANLRFSDFCITVCHVMPWQASRTWQSLPEAHRPVPLLVACEMKNVSHAFKFTSLALIQRDVYIFNPSHPPTFSVENWEMKARLWFWTSGSAHSSDGSLLHPNSFQRPNLCSPACLAL